jgi:hypothetical protein
VRDARRAHLPGHAFDRPRTIVAHARRSRHISRFHAIFISLPVSFD